MKRGFCIIQVAISRARIVIFGRAERLLVPCFGASQVSIFLSFFRYRFSRVPPLSTLSSSFIFFTKSLGGGVSHHGRGALVIPGLQLMLGCLRSYLFPVRYSVEFGCFFLFFFL